MPEAWVPVEPAGFAAAAALALVGATAFASLRPAAIVGHPRAVLACVLALCAAAAGALVRFHPPGLRLEIDPSTERLLPAGDPATAVYRRAVRDFGDDQLYAIAMETEGGVFRAENLAALRRVGDAVSRLEGVRSVRSLLRVPAFRYDREAETLEIQPFLEEIPEDPAALARLRERALADPTWRRNLVSEDGRSAGLNVSFREMSDRELIRSDLDGRIAAILAAETTPERRFHVSGRPHVKSRIYHGMTRDLAILIPTGLAVLAGVLALATGTLRGVLLPLANVGIAVVWTFAAMALLARPLGVLSVLLAPTLVAVGSVYGVHVVNRYEEDAAAGGERPEIVLRSMRHMIVPVLISGATTAVGYGALLWTDVPAVFEVGAFSVLGVACVTALSLTWLPALLVLLPLRPVSQPGARPEARLRISSRLGAALDRGLARLAAGTARRPGAVLLGWSLLAALAACAVPAIVVDTDYLAFFDPESRVRRDFEAIDRLLAGAVPLYVVVEGDLPGRLRDPETLRRLEALEARLAALPGVSRTFSFLEILRRLHRAVSGDDPAAEAIPATREGVAELLFLIPKSELSRFATVDQSAANLVVRTGAVGSSAMRELTRRIEAALADGGVPEGMRAFVTGHAVLLDRAADAVAWGQARTVGVAALTMFLLLAVGLGSVRLGLVAMVPNALPVLVFFGTLGLGAATLSLPTSLIASAALGIAIDDTAHYLVRYRAERRLGLDPEAAVRRCALAVGRPIALAGAMLILGFGSVAASEFATLRSFGLLSAWTLAVCLAADLVLLPALLLRGRSSQSTNSQIPMTAGGPRDHPLGI
jgi:predicted RND superfamily exporter protein